MPVRSLDSSVLEWPDAKTVDNAVRRWAEGIGVLFAEIVRIGYFGSYARGDWGVGSDLDIVVIVDRAQERFERRGAKWDVTGLPVPAEVMVYTVEEWGRLEGRFAKALSSQTVWVYRRGIP